MANHLDPETDEQDSLRLLSRSPHPYHHRYPNTSTTSSETSRGGASFRRYRSPPRPGTKDEDHHEALETRRSAQMVSWKGIESQDYTNSDSGTEADDEHFLKGLPAPRLRPHKGLRGISDDAISRTPSPVPSPAMYNEDNRKLPGARLSGSPRSISFEDDIIAACKRARRKRGFEWLRRGTEIALLSAIGAIVTSDAEVKSLIWNWRQGMRVRISYGEDRLTGLRTFISGPYNRRTVPSVSSEDCISKIPGGGADIGKSFSSTISLRSCASDIPTSSSSIRCFSPFESQSGRFTAKFDSGHCFSSARLGALDREGRGIFCITLVPFLYTPFFFYIFSSIRISLGQYRASQSKSQNESKLRNPLFALPPALLFMCHITLSHDHESAACRITSPFNFAH